MSTFIRDIGLNGKVLEEMPNGVLRLRDPETGSEVFLSSLSAEDLRDALREWLEDEPDEDKEALGDKLGEFCLQKDGSVFFREIGSKHHWKIEPADALSWAYAILARHV